MLTQEPDPSSPLGRLSLRARRVPAAIRAVVLLTAVAATLACAVADAGPYAFFADVQAGAMDGEHVLFLTFALTFLVFAIPAGAVIHLLAGRYPELPQPASPFGPGPFANSPFPQGPNPYNPQSPYWQAPPGGGPGAPFGQGYSPPGQGYSTPGQGYSPPGQGYSPPGQGYSPPGQGYSTPGQR